MSVLGGALAEARKSPTSLPETILGRLPTGDQMIVEVAASTFLEDGREVGRIFVMDEPTAALSSKEVERLFRIMGELKRAGGAIIYVYINSTRCSGSASITVLVTEPASRRSRQAGRPARC